MPKPIPDEEMAESSIVSYLHGTALALEDCCDSCSRSHADHPLLALVQQPKPGSIKYQPQCGLCVAPYTISIYARYLRP